MILLLLIILGLLIWRLSGELSWSRKTIDEAEYSCAGCGKQVNQAWGVCPYCQERLTRTCSACHQKTHLGHRYCPYCGQQSRQETR
ncbi:MAG: zinc ribbon domain-containing protein [Deltaproteobacteria bacterium]|jgi:RNA polymerase subunit RPABC4/transcription elongation factor Spt4|nr:zinc ribbon domain-containing protein [Deltaproteobacteria bacterium]MCW8892121.1 zinc ribbon domain-containing protein [Deltaproteobacteria bacterium]